MQPQLHAIDELFYDTRTIVEYNGITGNVAEEALRFFIEDCARFAQSIMNLCYSTIFGIGHTFVLIGELLENFVPQTRS